MLLPSVTVLSGLAAQSNSILLVNDMRAARVSVTTMTPLSGLESKRSDNVRAQSFDKGPTEDMRADEKIDSIDWVNGVVV
jgi:hypothetical protein